MADKPLFFFSVALITISIIFSYSLSSFAVLYYGYSEFHFMIRQLISGLLGIFIMLLIAKSNPQRFLLKFGFILFFGGIFLMFIMHFLPESLATSAGGAKRWIRLPFFSLAPVEFFKIGFVVFLAWSFSRKFSLEEQKDIKEEFLTFLPYVFVFLIAVYLIAILQNDLGQIVLLGTTLAIMMMFAGSSFKLFLYLLSLSFMLFIVVIITSTHRIMRIKAWWAGAQDIILSFFPQSIADSLRVENLPEPYQIQHSLNAISHGGFFGEGIGNGLIKLGFLSEVHTDVILAGITEEIGFFGLFCISLIFLGLIFRILKIANRCQNTIHYLFCSGVGVILGFSFLINAFGISGLIPIKGIAVPFLSYGGSSMLASCVMIGLVLSISKNTKLGG
ncbi:MULTISPECIES: peptidoglycan glycosyltransferase FtsW [Helicobacter]|uniref:Probable peptidoglycan glycosyltransferase FtsW n=1 Tax=Helicobacter ibis TaxID=2962633 RepID=A0ABT4VE37_9HELI|nr:MULTISPECIES: putative peptidoglycan glycosyltransferase FtsW [Helicobacter]MDA3966432.1 putative peptidoglycan glycosyltransferase FtsW [Helicobacter sp. WB40]MDA3968953.1 putative peptidoglycan glycosyltransferase FtsW [Helicobacter ibis]